MYKVTIEELVESGSTPPPILVRHIYYFTASELVKFSQIQKEFKVETVEPSRED